MGNFNLFVFALVFVLLSISSTSLSSALTTNEIDVEIVGEKSLVKQEIKTDFSGQIELEIPSDANILEISDENYTSSRGILRARADKSFRLEYLTEEFIDRNGKSYFLYNFVMPLKTDSLSVVLTLSEGAVLEDPKSAYPAPEITSDGRRIILMWDEGGLDSGEGFSTFVIFNERKQFSWGLLLSVLVILVALFAAGYYARHHIRKFFGGRRVESAVKPKAAAKDKSVKEMHLLESEAAVINALKKSGGEIWQKQIQISTGFSKAKLSRVIRDLEARGLIKRIPLGNTNKIQLK